MSSARYKSIPAKGLYLPGASHLGFDCYKVQSGDLVRYKEHLADGSYGYRTARALDLVTHDHEGKEYRAATGRGSQTKRAPLLRVFAFSDMLDTGSERWIDVGNVVQCVRVSPERARFVAWLVAGPLPKPTTILAAAAYGVASSLYFDRAADDTGALGEDWRARVEAFHLRGTVTVGALTIDGNGETGTDTLITIDDAATGEQLFQLEGDASEHKVSP